MCPFPSRHLILSLTQQHYYARTSNYKRPAYALKMHKSVCIINVCTHIHSPMVAIFSHMVFFPCIPFFSSFHVIAVATGFLFETILSTEERDGETGKGSLGMLLLILLQFLSLLLHSFLLCSGSGERDRVLAQTRTKVN